MMNTKVQFHNAINQIFAPSERVGRTDHTESVRRYKHVIICFRRQAGAQGTFSSRNEGRIRAGSRQHTSVTPPTATTTLSLLCGSTKTLFHRSKQQINIASKCIS